MERIDRRGGTERGRAHMASRTVTQVRAKIETRYANTFVPSCRPTAGVPA